MAASGRNYESVMSIFGSMEKELMVISDNGGYLAKGGEEMHCYSFPRDLLEEVVTMAIGSAMAALMSAKPTIR